MNNWTGPEKITATRLHPHGITPLRENVGKLFLLTLIIIILSLINSPVNSQVNKDGGLVQACLLYTSDAADE